MAELVMLAGVGISAYGKVKAGDERRRSAYIEAGQLDDKADVTRGATQREAAREKLIADYTGSTALAVAAASGAGVQNVNVLNLMAEIEAEGEYRAASRLYSGEQEAQGMEDAADNLRRGGDADRKVGRIQGASTILTGYTTFKGMYS